MGSNGEMEEVKGVAPHVSGVEGVEEGRGGVSMWEIKKNKLSMYPDPAFSLTTVTDNRYEDYIKQLDAVLVTAR